jgi:hypothetical protein
VDANSAAVFANFPTFPTSSVINELFRRIPNDSESRRRQAEMREPNDGRDCMMHDAYIYSSDILKAAPKQSFNVIALSKLGEFISFFYSRSLVHHRRLTTTAYYISIAQFSIVPSWLAAQVTSESQ